MLNIFIIFIVSLCRMISNCFCKLKGMIVPIQTTSDYIGTLGRIPFWEAKKRNIRIPTWTYNSRRQRKLKERYQKLYNHIYYLRKNTQKVFKMLTRRVVVLLTLEKERMVHPLEDSWCHMNFVRSKMSSGLRSGDRGGPATSLPCPIHCAGHVSFKKFRTMMGKCVGIPSLINYMRLLMGSGTACI